jgi:MFS family permease
MFSGLTETYREFPVTFWTLIGATFIDRVGGAILFPFLALYVTAHFGVGMTEVGVLFAIFAVSSILGGFVGGAATDRFGRRAALLFGLVTSALSSLAMGLTDSLSLLYVVAVIAGLLSNMAGPAQQAMIADLLPEKQHAEGYGILRVATNLAVVIGPALGGLLAARSYLLLFVLDALTSIATAIIAYLVLPETKPKAAEGESVETVTQTFAGYSVALRDRVYIAFVVASILMVTMAIQINSTLSVYLRDQHGVSEQAFGLIISLNAAMVVAFQFWITRRLAGFAPLKLMVVGTVFYALGFGLYGVVGTYWLFLLAMVVITIGEMIVSPTGQALAARMAPRTMRGRYLAVYGFSRAVPTAIGPLAAGLIMDNANPDLVWVAAAALGLLAAAAYAFLHLRAGSRLVAHEAGSEDVPSLLIAPATPTPQEAED